MQCNNHAALYPQHTITPQLWQWEWYTLTLRNELRKQVNFYRESDRGIQDLIRCCRKRKVKWFDATAKQFYVLQIGFKPGNVFVIKSLNLFCIIQSYTPQISFLIESSCSFTCIMWRRSLCSDTHLFCIELSVSAYAVLGAARLHGLYFFIPSSQ